MATRQDNRTELLRQIKDEVVNLKESPLYEDRINNGCYPVIGEGSHYAKIVFIGEGPGRNEALQGRPFCGAAGKILDELLASTDIKREDVYITNIIKDRPPLNRDPLPDEIKIYGPFLDRQLEIIKPEVIVTLGRFAMDYIMRKYNLEHLLKPISQMHGKVFTTKSLFDPVTIKVIPLYHPAVAVYNVNTKGDLIKDFAVLKDFA